MNFIDTDPFWPCLTVALLLICFGLLALNRQSLDLLRDVMERAPETDDSDADSDVNPAP